MTFTTTIDVDGEKVEVEVEADVSHDDDYDASGAEIISIIELCGDREFDVETYADETMETRAIETANY